MNMDLVALAAYGRPAVQPSAATNPAAAGIRPVQDPREALIPATPLAARNPADLRDSVGPRQASSTANARDEEEHPTVRGRAGAGPSVSGRRHHHGEEEGDRGQSLDVLV